MIKNKIENFTILDNEKVRVKECGNITEIMYQEHRSNGGCTCKVDKDHYIDTRTGEMKEFQHTDNRSQDIANVRKSMQKGRDMINANVINTEFCCWCTLTYKENMQDEKKLYNDFKNFIKRLKQKYGKFEYITCAEPQGRGAWHMHLLLIFDHKAPYIPNKDLANAWKQGFVKINVLTDVDNVGAYLSAYLCDVETEQAEKLNIDKSNYIEKETEIVDRIDGQKKTKKFIKGARLSMYPSGFHIFRFSKGCVEPKVSLMRYDTAKKEKVGCAEPTFTQCVEIIDIENDFQNTLKYEYYNKLK